MDSNAQITLNVGGTKVQTFKSTLEQLEYFRVLFKSNFRKEKEIFLDCDYNIFIHVLNKLRDASYKYPSGLTLNDLENITKMENYYSMLSVEQGKVCSIINVQPTSSHSESWDKPCGREIVTRTLHYEEYHIKHSMRLFNIIFKFKHRKSTLQFFEVLCGSTVILSFSTENINIFCVYEKCVTQLFTYCIKKEIIDFINNIITNDQNSLLFRCEGYDIEYAITAFI